MKYAIYGYLILVFMSCKSKVNVDMILENGKIYSVDSNFTVYESIAIKEGKIVNIGTSAEISSKYVSDSIIDLNGSFVYPGFNDAHCHFYSLAKNSEFEVDLKYTKTFNEVLDRVQKFVEGHNYEWIVGRGWDQNDWPDQNFPDNSVLNRMYPETPVVLIRIDGHAVLANEKALDLAGVSTETNFEGGEVFVEEGRMTGVLLDKAADHMKAHIPSPDREYKEAALISVQNDCVAAGLTSLTDAGLDKNIIALFDEMHNNGKLKIRINAMINPNEENYDYYLSNGVYETERLRVGTVKLYADGALGSRGACLLRPYNDDPENYGLIINSTDYYQEICEKALDSGYQVSTHAIGDSAVRMILDIYRYYLKPGNDLRWRIEHAQIVHPDDMQSFGDLVVIPSVQTTHATSDMNWVEERLGKKRSEFAYCYKDLMEQNGWLPNGTDFPIEEIYPLYSFYAAVSRKDLKGESKKGFQIENALDRESALRSITIWPAKAAFEEDQKGSLEKGKFADIVVLQDDIMEIEEQLIPSVKVKMTIINGEIIYDSEL